MKTKLRYATRKDIGKRVIVFDGYNNGVTGCISEYHPGVPFPWTVRTEKRNFILLRKEFRVVEHETLVDKEYEEMLV